MDAPIVPAPTHRRRLPFGIVVVALLRTADAVGLIIVALNLGQWPIAGVPLPFDELTVFRSLELATAAITLLGVAGLLTYRRWGWVLTVVLVGLGLVGDLLRVWLGEPTYLGLLLNVLTAFYLNTRSVKALAQRHLEHDEVTV